MYAFLFVAGVGAGIAGYLVGLASLISYPAMVAMGIPPVVANTSNTVGLLGSGAGSVVGGWKRLRSLKTYPLSWLLTVSLFGGLAGGLLLVIRGFLRRLCPGSLRSAQGSSLSAQ